MNHSSHIAIKSPKPRWFSGLLHSNSNTPSPKPDCESVKQNTSYRFNQQSTMSPFSEISMDVEEFQHKPDVRSEESDVQTIQFDEDIMFLQDVKLCDTTMFTPNIQYGKVVRVLSGSELLVAARIYNGYTKVLFPKLYCFRIRLRDVSFFGIHEDTATEELKRLVLDKIVLLTNTSMVTDGFIDAKVYLLHTNHLKHYLKYGCMMNIVCDDGNLYVNETINNYIKYRS